MAVTKRTVQFDMNFDVDGLSTIGQLEDELANINEELKGVEINSDAFKVLSKQAATANGKLREIDSSLQGFTSDEKSDSVKKLSEGLVGGFAAASSAAVLFGDESSEAMQKAIQKAGALFIAADGIDKVFKAMTRTNIAAMKATVVGFKKSAIAAKTFAKTTKGALAATGIGLLVIGIGLLIANFEKITEWFNKNFQPVIKGFQKLKEIMTGLGGVIKAAFTIGGESMKEAYNGAIEKAERLNEITEEWNLLIKKTKDELDTKVELLKLIGQSEEEILKSQKAYYISLIKTVDKLKEEGKEKEKHLTAQKDAYFQLQKISILEFNLNKQREEEREKEKDERKKRYDANKKDSEKLLDELRKRHEILNLKIRGIVSDKEAEEISKRFLENQNKIADAQDRINGGFEYQNELFEIVLSGYYGYLDLKNEIYDNDVRGNKLLEERTTKILPSEIGILKEKHSILIRFIKQYGELYGDNLSDVKLLGEILDKNVKSAGKSIELEAQGRRIRKDLLEDAGNELAIIKTAEDLYQEQLNVNKEMLIIRNDDLQVSIKNKQEQVEIKKYYIDELLLTNHNLEISLATTTDLEKRKAILDLMESNLNVIEKYNSDNLKNQKVITEFTKEQTFNSTKLSEIKKDEEKSLNRVAEAQGKITTQLIFQSRLYKQIQDLAAEYGGAVAEGIAASFDLIQTARQNAIIKAEEDLDRWTEKNEESLQKIADKKKSLDNEEKDLNDLLRDAEGDRYNDILAEIERVASEKEKNAAREKDLMNQQIEFENAIIKAQHEADKAAKKSAVIQSIIQTLLATVSALPNIVLAAIVGITGAIATAAIAAQVIPQPKYLKPLAEGGYTEKGGKYQPKGTVHAGEWVASQSLVNDPVAGAMISTLESMQRGYADGGGVSDGITPTIPKQATELINYDMLAAAMASQPIFASWTEGLDVGRNLKVVETRSSI